ncbi:hypothetical protein V6Z11_A08G125300 [Gossypium hirsutum]
MLHGRVVGRVGHTSVWAHFIQFVRLVRAECG